MAHVYIIIEKNNILIKEIESINEIDIDDNIYSDVIVEEIFHQQMKYCTCIWIKEIIQRDRQNAPFH